MHKAAPRAVDMVVGRLRAGGVHAEAVDDPNMIALLISFGTYRIRIAVPEEEEAEAKRIMAEWDREAAPRVADLARQVQRQFLLAALPATAVAVLLLSIGASWVAAFLCVLVVWFVSLLSIGALARRRARSDPGPEVD